MMRMDLASSMNAKIVGTGKETVILAHGYGVDQSVWDDILPQLATSHRVLVFDWCFSGAVKDPTCYDPAVYSSYDAFAEDLICIVDEMKLKSSIFVGHSMSAMIGCIASVKRPDLFKRLVLIGASPRFVNTEDYEGGFELSHIEHMFSSIESNFEEWASGFVSVVVDASDLDSQNKFANCLKRMRPEVALSLAKTVFLSDSRDILDKIAVSCDIIQTKKDAVVPNSVAGYMQSKIKTECKVNIIDTEGHFPQLTAHKQLAELLDMILS